MKNLLFLLLLIPGISFSQISDNFIDGDLLNNPEWIGQVDAFYVNTSNQLQLNTNEPGTSYISTANNNIDNTEWNFYIKMSFSPSVNNNLRIYLVAERDNLSTDINGYYLQLGENLSDDSIDLFRQDGSTSTKVIDGIAGHCASSPELRIKVTRGALGNWHLYSDVNAGTNFTLEGSVTDNTYTTTNYFGFLCKYTSSNTSKFYFDDIYVGEIIVDKEAPTLESIEIISANKLKLSFSESITQPSAEDISNYSVNNGVGNPTSATLNTTDNSIVSLIFATDFTEEITNTLIVENIEDNSGNTIKTITNDFLYFILNQYDILINEIMADPSPEIELPEYEYIELYNNTDFDISLVDCKLAVGSYVKTIPVTTINAHSYLILCDDEAETLFSEYGNTLAFETFPTLTNSGQTVTLIDNNGYIISSVSYSDSWYNDDYKNEGGWSLELIDPNNPCGGIENWGASENYLGGTPGQENSLFGDNPDEENPELLRAVTLSNNSIKLFFNEPFDTTTVFNISDYNVNNSIGNPTLVSPIAPEYKLLTLKFNDTFNAGVIYTITIDNNLSDCVGNNIENFNTARFALPDSAENNDIIINEILFNPAGEGKDYVEIYNNSARNINLAELRIATKDIETYKLDEIKNISKENYMIFPEEYIVLTTDIENIQTQYYTPNPNTLLKLAALPSYSNEDGIVVISDKWLNIIDEVKYNEEMHFDLLSDNDGVSLERINYNRPSGDETNWHSTAQPVGYGTPGYINSQFKEIGDANDKFSIDPEIFSPDNDGYDDIANINYKLDESGHVVNVTIFDGKGRIQRHLLQNELMNTSGAFSWDGKTNEGKKADVGIYIIYIELFDLNGNVKSYKKSCVLGAKLK